MDTALKRTFSSLQVYNFRLFFIGQGTSLCGTWAQQIGLSWLVLQLTHSGTQLGLVIAAQFLPMLLFGAWGGLIADRFNKQRTLYFTQSVAALLALTLGIIVVTHHTQLWMIYAVAAGLGLTQMIDSPTRQTFVIEMVGKERLRNAVTLNAMLTNTARIIGPSIAAGLIATVGIGVCFLVNAASYIALLVALVLMRKDQLEHTPPAPRATGQIRAGLRYIWSEPTLRAIIFMMFVTGTFAYEFPVSLALFATRTLHGSAGTYSALTAAMGLGAVAGGLYAAGKGAGTAKLVTQATFFFGLSVTLLAAMPGLTSALVVLVAVGVLSVFFISLSNTTLQLTSEPTMRGRVMAIYAIAFLGTTPIGGPIIGYISDHSNPRVGLFVGGIAAILAAAVGYVAARPKATA